VAVAGEDHEVGVAAEVDRQRRRDPAVLAPDLVGGIVAVGGLRGDAQRGAAVGGQRLVDVGRERAAVEAAEVQAGIEAAHRLGPLAHRVDQAAGLHLAVQD